MPTHGDGDQRSACLFETPYFPFETPYFPLRRSRSGDQGTNNILIGDKG